MVKVFPRCGNHARAKTLKGIDRSGSKWSQISTFFAILHSGIENVSAAHHIDPDYYRLIKQAEQAGVEIICYKATLNKDEIKLSHCMNFNQ